MIKLGVFILPDKSLKLKLSLKACQLASIIFSETPTVDQEDVPSELSISTRTLALVPSCSFKTRTL